MPCVCNSKRVVLLPAMFVSSILVMYIIRRPSMEESKKFLYFITKEVGEELFIKQGIIVFFPLMLIAALPLLVWKIVFAPFVAIGAVNAFRFYYYYFLSVKFPALVSFINTTLPAKVLPYIPACTAAVCDWQADLKVNQMINLWFEDMCWLFLVVIVWVIVDGIRYRVAPLTIALFVITNAVFGWDTMTPIWIIYLRTKELEYAEKGLAKVPTPFDGLMKYLYFSLAMISVITWWFPLMTWANTVATVAGQLDMGLASPSGARATILIMGTFFPWVIYTTVDCKWGEGVKGFVATTIMRIGVMWLFMGHVAGAAGILLMYREMQPNRTMVPYAADEKEKAN